MFNLITLESIRIRLKRHPALVPQVIVTHRSVRRGPGEERGDVDGPPRRGASLSDHSLQTPSAPGGRRRDVSRDAAAQTPVAQRGEEESECRTH